MGREPGKGVGAAASVSPDAEHLQMQMTGLQNDKAFL